MPRIVYTAQEYANMHLIYGECAMNANAAARLYRERYPNEPRYPDYRVFIRVHQCYREGRFPGRGVGGAAEVGQLINPQHEEIVLHEIEADETTSTRAIARRTGVPKSTVHRILKKRFQLYPFHVTRVHTLLPRDYNARVIFCRQMIQRMEEDDDFFNKILWSDESTCRRDGYMNLHNLHYWCLENPHAMREDKSQYQFKINYWTGIINGQIIGPIEIHGNLNGNNYLELLRDTLPEFLEELPEELRQDMWFQNDGCPAHYAVQVRRYLNEAYPNRWIGRLGPILWPPRSPDLNPLDFFYWGALKEKVYNKPINSLQVLRHRVQNAAREITARRHARLLRRAFIRRCRACIRVGGRQFEHLL